MPHHGGNPATAPPIISAPPGMNHRDGNGDIPMHDIHGAHAGVKYPMRPHHQSHHSHSSVGRQSNLQSPHDHQPSTAAQRYSPMDTLSPTSPYAAKTGQFSGPPSQAQSPAGTGEYAHSPYYAQRPSVRQLPPITPFASSQEGYPSSAVAHLDGAFADGSKSPARQNPPLPRVVPEFRKVNGPMDLQPKVTRQPPFRRANPEGGFISVSNYHNSAPAQEPHALNRFSSLSKPLPATCRQRIASATQASNTRRLETPAES